jgi:tetratricopeptide (TPR) repeat protein
MQPQALHPPRMRMPRMHAFALACALLSIVTCSTSPKQSDTVITVKTQADQAAASGEAYYRQGRYDLALQFFTQALSQYTSVDDGEGIVRSYNSIGKSYIALGSLDMAEDIFLRARDRARAEITSLLFDSSINLGELYLAKGDALAARTILLEASAMPYPGRPPAQSALLYHDLGTAEKNLGDSTKALEYYGLSLKTNLSNRSLAEAASDYYMIASVHSRDGRYDEALKNALLALSYDKQVESSPAIAKDLYALGLITAKKGDHAAAFDYFQRSYFVSTSLGFRDNMKKALAGLVAAADALGRTADAEAYRKSLADMQNPPADVPGGFSAAGSP